MAKTISPHLGSDPYLRLRQREYDQIFFDRKYASLNTADSKVRHIREHIGKAGFKLEILNRQFTKVSMIDLEKILANEIVPDLAMYRTQLANTLRIDLIPILDRLEPQAIDLSKAVGHVAMAGGAIDFRVEPLEHANASTQESRQRITDITIPELHLAAAGLAIAFDLGSVDRLHHARLAYNSEQPAMAV